MEDKEIWLDIMKTVAPAVIRSVSPLLDGWSDRSIHITNKIFDAYKRKFPTEKIK